MTVDEQEVQRLRAEVQAVAARQAERRAEAERARRSRDEQYRKQLAKHTQHPLGAHGWTRASRGDCR